MPPSSPIQTGIQYTQCYHGNHMIERASRWGGRCQSIGLTRFSLLSKKSARELWSEHWPDREVELVIGRVHPTTQYKRLGWYRLNQEMKRGWERIVCHVFAWRFHVKFNNLVFL
eukprot:sb/3476824/